MNEPLFDDWPRKIRGIAIEPGSGQVRFKPIGADAYWLPVSDVRELALCASPSKRALLQAAALEATRQEAIRDGQMDERV